MSKILDEIFSVLKGLEKPAQGEAADKPLPDQVVPALPQGSRPVNPVQGWDPKALQTIRLADEQRNIAPGVGAATPRPEPLAGLVEPVSSAPPMRQSDVSALASQIAPIPPKLNKADGSTSTPIPSSSTSAPASSSSSPSTSTPPAPPAQPVRVSPNGPGPNPQAGQLDGLADKIAPKNDARTRK